MLRAYFRAQEASVLARLDASGYVALGVTERRRGVRKNVGASTPFNQAEWNAKLAAKADPFIQLAYTDAAQATYAQGLELNPDLHVNVGTAFDVTNVAAAHYLAAKPQTFAQQVNATTYMQLQGKLIIGIFEGEPLSKLKDRVRTVFSGISDHRVEAIARTEVLGSSNGGSLAGAMQSPAFLTKTWLAALDTRTRLSHVGAHNQTVPKDQPFKVGNSEGQAPHAFTAAREVVNCRCTMIFGTTALGLPYVVPGTPAPAAVPPAPTPPPTPAVVTPPPAPATVTPAPARAPRVPRTPRVPRVPKPVPVKQPKVVVQEPFPDDVDALEVVKQLPGSTGAQLVRDPKTGAMFVRKRAKGTDFADGIRREEHLREEMTADAVYRAFGTNVPEFQQYRDASGVLVKLSRYIPDTTSLADLDPAAKKKAIAQLRQGFAVDALLGNWDVIGLGEDNVLIGKDGTVYRIDNGGALRFRAQGQPKAPDAFNEGVVDLWGMRDAKINRSAAGVFGTLTPAEIATQARAAVAKWDSTDMESVFGAYQENDALYDLVAKRVDNLGRYARQAQALTADKYVDTYVERFTRSYQQLMQGGLAAALPKELTYDPSQGNDQRYVYDENGKLFDHLRSAASATGRRSALGIMQDVMKDEGGDYQDVIQWAYGQTGSSWDTNPILVKSWYAAQRTAGFDEYFRPRGADGNVELKSGGYAKSHAEVRQGLGDALSAGQFRGAREAADKVVRTAAMTDAQYEAAYTAAALESFETTFAMQNAFSYALLEKARITARRDDFGDPYTMRLIRTEPDSAINGSISKDEVKIIKRGGMESASAITAIVVSGDNLTMTDVPIHRIMGTYYQGRNLAGDRENDMFAGIGENEFVAHLEGLPTRYIGNVGRGNPSRYERIRDQILAAPTLNDIPDNLL
jgi:hypothetical protein